MTLYNSEYEVWCEDCQEGLVNRVEDGSVDLIFTDPPYGIEGDKLDAVYHREESLVVEGYKEVALETYGDFSNKWISECARTLRPGGSMYIVSGYTNLHHVLNALHSTDLKEVNHIIAYYPFGASTTRKWVSSHYHVLFWMKPEKKDKKRTFNNNVYYSDQTDSYRDRLSVQDMLRGGGIGKRKNKNQLNEKFIEKFILYSSNRGDVVMDPFCGGFTTARTAIRYGRKFIGFELNEHAYKEFLPTLDKVKLEGDPDPIKPDADQIIIREKNRAGWAAKRKERKEKKIGNTIIP